MRQQVDLSYTKQLDDNLLGELKRYNRPKGSIIGYNVLLTGGV
jgi:hypothetical protein